MSPLATAPLRLPRRLARCLPPPTTGIDALYAPRATNTTATTAPYHAGTDPAKVAAIAKKHAFALDITEGGAVPEAAALADGVSDAMDVMVETKKFADALEAGEDLVYLYRSIYRMVHPRVALRYLTMGLVALKANQYPKAADSLQKASRLLGVTHGKEHAVTANATETLSLVKQLMG